MQQGDGAAHTLGWILQARAGLNPVRADFCPRMCSATRVSKVLLVRQRLRGTGKTPRVTSIVRPSQRLILTPATSQLYKKGFQKQVFFFFFKRKQQL